MRSMLISGISEIFWGAKGEKSLPWTNFVKVFMVSITFFTFVIIIEGTRPPCPPNPTIMNVSLHFKNLLIHAKD